MGAFKSLTSQDVIITPFVVNKSFSFIGYTDFGGNNIERLQGTNITGSFNISEATTGINDNFYQRDIYNIAKQLYYTNELPNPEGIYIVTDLNNNIIENNTKTNVHSRFDNYLNSTLHYSSSFRYFPTGSDDVIAVLSIPNILYGDYINPGSFVFQPIGAGNLYKDNGEGYVVNYYNTQEVFGVINYQHGTVIFTNPDFEFSDFFDPTNPTVYVSFQSARTIYETQYKCTLRENEFNYSLNPSIISGSNFTNPLNSSCSIDIRGQVYDFVTGSVWTPYVTTVGLYNESNELLAVAKLSQPLPTSRTTDMSILINLDK